MTYLSPEIDVSETSFFSPEQLRSDPRVAMAEELPGFVQPFLTWLTAKPAPGETPRDIPPRRFVLWGLLQVFGGIALAWVACHTPLALAFVLAPAGLLISTSGMGLFQVVIFHHCSHGTVFQRRETNVTVGRLVSAVLLFKHFDIYKREHMIHHSNNKLLTDEDEFADFVFGMCGLRSGLSKRALWRRVLVNLASPRFHAVFLYRRTRAAFCSHDKAHNLTGLSIWAVLWAAAIVTGETLPFLLAVVLPVTVLLQIATVFRILCEHRFPEPELIARRGKEFTSHATAGVFPGVWPPMRINGHVSQVAWLRWWAEMLTIQLLVRLFVMVGDAPCHDFHHRRPASRRWTTYIQARQHDVDTLATGAQGRYQEVWGLFRAIDEMLDSLSRTPPGTLAH